MPNVTLVPVFRGYAAPMVVGVGNTANTIKENDNMAEESLATVVNDMDPLMWYVLGGCLAISTYQKLVRLFWRFVFWADRKYYR